jgi:hypothetical protein
MSYPVDMDMQYGHAVWTCKMNIKHGHGYLSRLRNTKKYVLPDLLIHVVHKSDNFFVSPLILRLSGSGILDFRKCKSVNPYSFR